MPPLEVRTIASITRAKCSRQLNSILPCMAYTIKALGEAPRALGEAQSMRARDVKRDPLLSGMAARA